MGGGGLCVLLGYMVTCNSLQYFTFLQNYLKTTNHPLQPVTCVREGAQGKYFDMALAA